MKAVSVLLPRYRAQLRGQGNGYISHSVVDGKFEGWVEKQNLDNVSSYMEYSVNLNHQEL